MQKKSHGLFFFLLPVARMSVKIDRVALKVARRQITTAQLPRLPHNISGSE